MRGKVWPKKRAKKTRGTPSLDVRKRCQQETEQTDEVGRGEVGVLFQQPPEEGISKQGELVSCLTCG